MLSGSGRLSAKTSAAERRLLWYWSIEDALGSDDVVPSPPPPPLRGLESDAFTCCGLPPDPERPLVGTVTGLLLIVVDASVLVGLETL